MKDTRVDQLLELEFEQNDDQRTFAIYLGDGHIYIDYWKVKEYGDNEWSKLIKNSEDLIKDCKNKL